MDNGKLQAFLKRISMIESSGGKNVNHQLLSNGIHAGTKAVGQYGLMPATVAEIINRQKREGTLDTGVASLQGLNNEALGSALSEHPELEQNLAGYLANRVLTRNNGNEDAAAYSWTMGHNLSPERITEDKLAASDYVNKYKKLKAKDTDEEAKQRALTLLASN